jgi:oligopeptide/dipeptide ABC transporter ATP-binding protein
MEILWRIEHVRKIYQFKSELGETRLTTALDGLDLDIYRAETLGIVGESGCGKSTLGKVLLKLVEPSSGKIFYRGQDLTTLPESALRPLRRKFQIVFQDPYKSLNPRLPAGYSVLEGMGHLPGSEKQARLENLLDRVGIAPESFHRFPHQFSGGQRQRIAIARALAPDPKFLVLDEPTSNLDLSIQAQILNLLMELKSSFSLTYLFISHNLKVIEFISDRIGVIYRGRLVEIGRTEQIMNNALHPYTRLLLAASFFRKEYRKAVHQETVTGCSYAGRCPESKDVCYHKTPLLKETEAGHSVACWLY